VIFSYKNSTLKDNDNKNSTLKDNDNFDTGEDKDGQVQVIFSK
jgi:hypothetical protein